MEKYPGWLNINDTYKIKKDLAELKAVIEEIEKDINVLLGPKKVETRSTSARRKLRYLRKELIPTMAKKIFCAVKKNYFI